MRIFHSVWILIPLYCFLLCNSCQTTSIISLQILESPEVTLPLDVQKITVINRSRKINLPVQNHDSSRTGLPLNDLQLASNIAHNCIQGITDMMITSPFVDTIFYDTLTYYFELSKDSAGRLLPVSWQDVEWLCAKNNSELLISLEDFNFSDTVFQDIEYSYFNNDKYAIVNRNHIAYLNVIPRVFWRVYDFENKRITDEYFYIDTIQWESVANQQPEALKLLPERETAILEAAYWAGYGYGKRIVPFWLDVDRFYYSAGNKELRQANRQIYEDNWAAAINIWKKLAYDERKRLSAKAALNMALACEIEDELDIALEWAVKSYNTLKKPVSKKYVELLVQRIREKRRLLRR
jgi:hypothetical protein